MTLDHRPSLSVHWICVALVAVWAAGCDVDQEYGGSAGSPDASTAGGSGSRNHGGGSSGAYARADASAAGPQYGGGAGEGAGGAGDPGVPDAGAPPSGTNISFSGAQDFGFFRRLLDDGIVPTRETVDAAGFFAEHHTELPLPDCGERICLHAMLGVMGSLMSGNHCTMLQLGLNSPLSSDRIERPPLTLAIVVDTSGSMSADGKMNFVRRGLAQMVNEMNDDDQIALITYSDNAVTHTEMGGVRGRRNALHGAVDDLDADGSTNLYEGLELGFQTVLEHYDSGRQNRVIMLSDGQPTAGDTSADHILAMAAAYNSEGIGLTTVGLGTDFNYELMRGLAEQGDGNFYFVEDAGAVDEVFTEELAYFTVPVAFDLELELRVGPDYTFGDAYGSHLWQDTPDGGRLEIPSVFLAHRVAHDDVHCTDDPDDPDPQCGRRGGGSALLIELMPRNDDGSRPEFADVATALVRFREPGTDLIVEDEIRVRYPHAPWLLHRAGFFENPIVEKSFVMLNIAIALQQACDRFHIDGDADGAVALLRRVILAVADYADSANDGEGDLDMAYDIELMEQFIDVLRAQGGQEPDEDDLPEDPWPAD